MHPPMLPNPSGDGLQHYKKKSVIEPLGGESSMNKLGIDALLDYDVTSSELLILRLFEF